MQRRVPAEQRVEIADELVEALLAECAVEGLTLRPAARAPTRRHPRPRAPTGVGQGAAPPARARAALARRRRGRGAHAHAGPARALGGVEGILENHLRAALDSLSLARAGHRRKMLRPPRQPHQDEDRLPRLRPQRGGRADDEREVTAVLDKLCAAETGRILHAVDTGQGEGGQELRALRTPTSSPNRSSPGRRSTRRRSTGRPRSSAGARSGVSTGTDRHRAGHAGGGLRRARRLGARATQRRQGTRQRRRRRSPLHPPLTSSWTAIATSRCS